jgi:hypothetical protein
MKRIIASILPGFLVLGLTGCDLFDKVDDVTFQASLPLEFVIDEQMVSQEPVMYADAEVLNAIDDPEVAKYKDKITEIKLNSISYEINDFAAPGAVTFTAGSLKLASGETLATAASIPMENTAETDLTGINQDGFSAFASDILGDKQVGVNLQGSFSQTPVAFTLTVYFHVTIKAEALK